MTVSATFQPDGAEPAWGSFLVKGNSTWRVGFRILGVFTGRGNYRQCKFYQNEDGKLEWTIDGKSAQIVGKSPNVIAKFEKATFTGDMWTLEYNDALGAEMSKRFKVEGSVKAQAAQKGGKPALTNPMITYTPLP